MGWASGPEGGDSFYATCNICGKTRFETKIRRNRSPTRYFLLVVERLVDYGGAVLYFLLFILS